LDFLSLFCEERGSHVDFDASLVNGVILPFDGGVSASNGSPTFLHCLVKAKDFKVCRSFVLVGERRPQSAHLRSGGMSHLGRLSGGEADYACSG
jgi:hypothetical protein